MIYQNAKEWRAAPRKKVLLFGMSGLGKTHVSNMLRDQGNWFHYSIDYRIGTRYMGEHIADNAKAEAMKVPFLRDLLLTDSIYIGSNITFNNLAPLSAYLGKPGNSDKGGVPFEEYMRRQEQHQRAETAALLDTAHFIERAAHLYDYPHFVCDTGGSICEVVDPANPEDPVLKALSTCTLMVWIEGSEAHTEELVRRFDRAPKPMYYKPEYLRARWNDYLEATGQAPEEVDPDAFVRRVYAHALGARHPIYERMSRWGVKVRAEDVAKVQSESDFIDLVAKAIEAV